jgi:hypothetical protein
VTEAKQLTYSTDPERNIKSVEDLDRRTEARAKARLAARSAAAEVRAMTWTSAPKRGEVAYPLAELRQAQAQGNWFLRLWRKVIGWFQ